MNDPLLTPTELAAYLARPVRTIGQWRYRGVGPAFIKVGGQVRYRQSVVEAWLAARTTDPATAALASDDLIESDWGSKVHKALRALQADERPLHGPESDESHEEDQ